MRMLKPFVVIAFMAAGVAQSADETSPALRLNGFLESLEIAPVLLAADRPPRDRATLARLIDYSLLDEIMAENANGRK